jgi:hypothetical protein
MIHLSPHFTLEELTVSETAARVGIDMRPPADVVENLRRLAVLVLEPVRSAVGGALRITSGYRPAALNDLIGGSRTSDHLRGLAADCFAPTLSLGELVTRVRALEHEIPLRQCILEFGSWVHLSCEPIAAEPRREFLSATRENGRTVYRALEA